MQESLEEKIRADDCVNMNVEEQWMLELATS
jgi:hypothetical protein